MSKNDLEKPKRRVRYKGTHPKNFEEKYKEHQLEKYQADVEKIKSRGATPAGTHIPICVKEVLAALSLKAGQTVLDCTLGYGGHSTEFAKVIGQSGKLIGLDQDPIERPKTEARLRAAFSNGPQLIFGAVNFREAKRFLASQGISKVDAVFADLGLSSMQIDDPKRGFTLKADVPLDLRMNPEKGLSAAELIKESSVNEIENWLHEYSDEPRARVLAKAIKVALPRSTLELKNCVEGAVAGFSKRVQKEEGIATLRRAVQALRIRANDELLALEELLADIPSILRPGGAVAFLAFHSGEDRRVKKALQNFVRGGQMSWAVDEFVRPSRDEQTLNPRSRSAKLRWARK